MKKALRIAAAVPAAGLVLVAVPLTYYGLAMLLAEMLFAPPGAAATVPVLYVLGGPFCLFAGILALHALFPARFR